MAKKFAPLDYYQQQFNDSWASLHALIQEDLESVDEEDAPPIKAWVTYMDAQAQLLDELIWAVKQDKKKSKKKSKKK